MYTSLRKKGIYTGILIIMLFLVQAKTVFAQGTYPVSVMTQVLPPYSVYLNDYTSLETERFAVTLTLNDAAWPAIDVRLKIIIEGEGIEISTKDNYMGTPITLNQHVPERITGASLTGYLNPANMNFKGISRAEFMQRGSKLKEGMYWFKVIVYEARRGVTLSNPMSPASRAMAWLVLNSPPIWVTPQQNQTVGASDPQNIIFTWLPMHTSSPNAAFTSEYEFQINEIWPPNNNPNIIINTTTPIYKTTTQNTRLVYGPEMPMLEPGKKYACRLRAYDTQGADVFKNNGFSEVLVFTFGKPCKIPLNINHETPGKQDIKIKWNPFPENTEFSIQYREKGQENWYNKKTDETPYNLRGLNSGKTYEYQLKALCGSVSSLYSEIKEFKTAELENSNLDCNGNANVPAIDGSPLIDDLNVGDIISVGGFYGKITEVQKNGDSFSGNCMLLTFWAFQINCTFKNIKVNESMQVTQGHIDAFKSEMPSEFITPPDDPGTGDDPGNGGDPGTVVNPGDGNNTTINSDTTITHTDKKVKDIYTDENGNTVILYDDGTTETIPEGVTVTVTDANGNEIVVNKDGSVTQNGEPVDKKRMYNNITKICFADKNKIIIHDGNEEKEPVKIKSNKKLTDKTGYTYWVDKNKVEVENEDKFIYPVLEKKGECYSIKHLEPEPYNGIANSICFNNLKFIINGDNAPKEEHPFNKILQDKDGTKFYINENGLLKIENSSGSSGTKDNEGNIIPENWEKKEKCFITKAETTEEHEIINKICFTEAREDNTFTVYDNNKEKLYNKELLYFRDKWDYLYKVENKKVEIVKTSKFVYPIIKENNNCYEIENVVPFEIDKNVQKLCIESKKYIITDEAGVVTSYDSLNKIFTDKNNITFLIKQNGAYKILDKDSKDITQKWNKEKNCLISPSTSSSNCDITYDGKIDFVFKYNNKLHIKSTTGSIKTIGEVNNTCVEDEDTIIKINDEDKYIFYKEGQKWEDTKIKKYFNNQTNKNKVFFNFGVWSFEDLEEFSFKNFPITICYFDYIHMLEDADYFNKAFENSDNFYNDNYNNSLIVIYYNKASMLSIKKLNTGNYNENKFKDIAENFRKNLQDEINSGNSGKKSLEELLKKLFVLMIDEYSDEDLVKIGLPLTEYILKNYPNNQSNLEEFILANNHPIDCYYSNEKNKIVFKDHNIEKEVKPFSYIRIGYKDKSKSSNTFVEVPGVLAYLIYEDGWDSGWGSFEMGTTIKNFIENYKLFAQGTTSKFNIPELFKKLNLFHSGNSITLDRKEFQHLDGTAYSVEEKVQGFNNSIYIDMLTEPESIKHHKFSKIDNNNSVYQYNYKYCLEYIGNSNKSILKIYCKNAIDLYTLALKIGISEDDFMVNILNEILKELIEEKDCDKLDEILAKLSTYVLSKVKDHENLNYEKKIDFLKILSGCNMDNSGVDEEAIVISIFESILGSGQEKDFLDELEKGNFLSELIHDIDGQDRLALGKVITKIWAKTKQNKDWNLLKNSNGTVTVTGNDKGEIARSYDIFPLGPSHKFWPKYYFDISRNSMRVSIRKIPLLGEQLPASHDFFDPILFCFTTKEDGGNKTNVDAMIVPAIYAHCYRHAEASGIYEKDLRTFATIASYALSIYSIYSAPSKIWVIINSLKLAGDIATDIFTITNTQDPYAQDFIKLWNTISTLESMVDGAQLIKILGQQGANVAKRGIRYYKFKKLGIQKGYKELSQMDADELIEYFSKRVAADVWENTGEVADFLDNFGYKNLRLNSNYNLEIKNYDVVINYKNGSNNLELFRIKGDKTEIIYNEWRNYSLSDDNIKHLLGDFIAKPDDFTKLVNNHDLLEYWKIISTREASTLRRNIKNLEILKTSSTKLNGGLSLKDALSKCQSKQRLINELENTNKLFDGIDDVKYKLETAGGGYTSLSLMNGSDKIATVGTHGNSIQLKLEKTILKDLPGKTSKKINGIKILDNNGNVIKNGLFFETDISFNLKAILGKGDVLYGKTIANIKYGNNDKIALIGRKMDHIKPIAEKLKIQEKTVEIFDQDYFPTKYQFEIEGKKYTWNDLNDDFKNGNYIRDNVTKYILDSELPKTLIYKANKQWAEKLKNQGYHIIDMGYPAGVTSKSVFYDMELNTIFTN